MDNNVSKNVINNVFGELNNLKINVAKLSADKILFEQSYCSMRQSITKVENTVLSLARDFNAIDNKVKVIIEQINALQKKVNGCVSSNDSVISMNSNIMGTELSDIDSSITLGSQNTTSNISSDTYSKNSGLAAPDSTDLFIEEQDGDYIPSDPLGDTTDSSSIKIME